MSYEANVKAQVKAFLMQSFRDYDFKEDENIFALGFVNSLFVMQLVNFLETEFDLTVENEDLEIENFSSINALASLVLRKQPV